MPFYQQDKAKAVVKQTTTTTTTTGVLILLLYAQSWFSRICLKFWVKSLHFQDWGEVFFSYNHINTTSSPDIYLLYGRIADWSTLWQREIFWGNEVSVRQAIKAGSVIDDMAAATQHQRVWTYSQGWPVWSSRLIWSRRRNVFCNMCACYDTSSL